MIELNGKTYSGNGQSVSMSDGYLDFYNAAPVQSVEAELDRHVLDDVRPVQGYAPYTHIITFEDVIWGILVTEK